MYYEYTSTRKQVLKSVIKIVLTILQVTFYNSTKIETRVLMTFESGFKIFHMTRRKQMKL